MIVPLSGFILSVQCELTHHAIGIPPLCSWLSCVYAFVYPLIYGANSDIRSILILCLIIRYICILIYAHGALVILISLLCFVYLLVSWRVFSCTFSLLSIVLASSIECVFVNLSRNVSWRNHIWCIYLIKNVLSQCINNASAMRE